MLAVCITKRKNLKSAASVRLSQCNEYKFILMLVQFKKINGFVRGFQDGCNVGYHGWIFNLAKGPTYSRTFIYETPWSTGFWRCNLFL